MSSVSCFASLMMRKKILLSSRNFSRVIFNGSRPYSNSSTSALVLCEDRDGMRHITLNNPKQRNVLSSAVLLELKTSLEKDTAKTNSPIHCIIIKAEGNVFSAGHDLKELMSENKDYHLKIFNYCASLMMAIQNSPIPVIAQVKGLATAAGCQLVASCDIVIAGESAKFSTPGSSVGLFCSTPGVALVRAVPRKIASYMLLTGLPISAREAAQHGLVSCLVPDNKVEEETMAVARAICEKSRPVQRLGKAFFLKQQHMSIAEAYREGAEVMRDNLALQDAQTGIEAFSKKQKPTWSHTTDRAH